MLIKRADLEKIVAGEVSLAFRKWKRPTVRAGGRLRTAIGVLAIDSVKPIRAQDIRTADVKKAGYRSRNELMEQLRSHTGQLYRIQLRYLGEDPRQQLGRKKKLSRAAASELEQKLNRMDTSSRQGSWTRKTLNAIDAFPGFPAAQLAAKLKFDKLWLKRNVRRLKELGLTESLPTGYRLSPRGRSLLEAMQRNSR